MLQRHRIVKSRGSTRARKIVLLVIDTDLLFILSVDCSGRRIFTNMY